MSANFDCIEQATRFYARLSAYKDEYVTSDCFAISDADKGERECRPAG